MDSGITIAAPDLAPPRSVEQRLDAIEAQLGAMTETLDKLAQLSVIAEGLLESPLAAQFLGKRG